MRRAGAQWRDIAKALGWSSPASAFEAVQKLLKATVREDAETVMAMELERLDELQDILRQQVKANSRHSARAAEVLIKVMERRAKLLGLDAAEKHDVQIAVPKVIEYVRDQRQDEHKIGVDRLLESGGRVAEQ